MKTTLTQTSAIQSSGCRLDASYHASPGVQALHFLQQWANHATLRHKPTSRVLREEPVEYRVGRRLDLLRDVCEPNGIFIPGRFKRIYVDDPEYGEPWLSPSEMQRTDLSDLRYVSRKFTPALNTLRIHEGYILLSRSGTIGNMVYVRSDMDGLIGSDDIIRIVANRNKIPPGYLYAYLNSPIGQALIEQKTYGAVISHIEVHHVLDLPIPRLDIDTEQRAHELIEQAAQLRTEATNLLLQAQKRFERDILGIEPGKYQWKHQHEHAFAVKAAKSCSRHHRLDAFHYTGYANEIPFTSTTWTDLGRYVKPFQPTLFKRPYTDDGGIPFLTGIDLYDIHPRPRMYISRYTKNIEQYLVETGTILVQRVGQRYGLFGRPTILPTHLHKTAVTEHLFRLFPHDNRDRGFIFIWLSSQLGRRCLLKHSFGTSMGVLAEHSFSETAIPECSSEIRHSFETEVQQICNYRDSANQLEDQVQALLMHEMNLV